MVYDKKRLLQIAYTVQSYRLGQDMSIEDLAEECNMAPEDITAVEQGTLPLNDELVDRIARGLAIPTWELHI